MGAGRRIAQQRISISNREELNVRSVESVTLTAFGSGPRVHPTMSVNIDLIFARIARRA